MTSSYYDSATSGYADGPRLSAPPPAKIIAWLPATEETWVANPEGWYRGEGRAYRPNTHFHHHRVIAWAIVEYSWLPDSMEDWEYGYRRTTQPIPVTMEEANPLDQMPKDGDLYMGDPILAYRDINAEGDETWHYSLIFHDRMTEREALDYVNSSRSDKWRPREPNDECKKWNGKHTFGDVRRALAALSPEQRKDILNKHADGARELKYINSDNYDAIFEGCDSLNIESDPMFANAS